MFTTDRKLPVSPAPRVGGRGQETGTTSVPESTTFGRPWLQSKSRV